MSVKKTSVGQLSQTAELTCIFSGSVGRNLARVVALYSVAKDRDCLPSFSWEVRRKWRKMYDTMYDIVKIRVRYPAFFESRIDLKLTCLKKIFVWIMRSSSTFRNTGVLKRVAIVAVCLFVFCEYLIYYVVILQCSWPEINIEETRRRSEPLKAMFLTDTHLLGSKDGHWFDKLRREWQMERAFQTAVAHFNPDVVFLLGDLFDEGMKCSDEVRQN